MNFVKFLSADGATFLRFFVANHAKNVEALSLDKFISAVIATARTFKVI